MFTAQYVYYYLSNYESASDLVTIILGGISSTALLAIDTYKCIDRTNIQKASSQDSGFSVMEWVEQGVFIFSAGSFIFGAVYQSIAGEWVAVIEEVAGLASAITRLVMKPIF